MDYLTKELQLPNWLIDDNKARRDKYVRNIEDELFLRELNHSLIDLEASLNVSDSDQHPILFFFGVPRCGKTMFSQCLVHALDVAYPNNMIARFWEVPLVGLKLSNILLSQQQSISFISDYGKTSTLSDPHDFAALSISRIEVTGVRHTPFYDYENAADLINWDGLANKINNLAHHSQKAFVFKGVNPTYHLAKIAEVIPYAFFIYVERHYIDAALSLRKARMDNYGILEKWYGQTPKPDVYEKIRKLPYHEQIAHQFKELTVFFENQLLRVPTNRVLRINYKDFCAAPNEIISTIVSKIESTFNYSIPIIKKIENEKINYSSHSSEKPGYEELTESLQKVGLSTIC